MDRPLPAASDQSQAGSSRALRTPLRITLMATMASATMLLSPVYASASAITTGSTATGSTGTASTGTGSTVTAVTAPVTEPALQAFARWDDDRYYLPLAGGRFEADSAAYNFSGGAHLVRGNEPWHVWCSTDKRALSLPAGSSATVTSVETFLEDVRFFVNAPGIATAELDVAITIDAVDEVGNAEPVTVRYRLDGSKAGWSPSPVLELPIEGPQLVPTSVHVTLTPIGPGTWNVDELLMDPWRVD